MKHCKQCNQKPQPKEVSEMESVAEEQIVSDEKLRLNEFADYLGTTITNVRGLIHRREVDFFKFGKLILVPLSEAERILRDGFRPRQINDHAK